MENNESQSIQKSLENKINEYIVKDKSENKMKIKLIYGIAILSFAFICVSTFLSYKNYQKIQKETTSDQKIVKVVVKEY